MKTKSNKSTLIIIGVVLVVALVVIAALGASLLKPPSDGSNENNDSSTSTGSSSNTYGMSVLRIEKNNATLSTQPKYDIQLRIWNNGTSPLSLSLFNFNSLGSDGVYYYASYATGKIWSSTSISPGYYTDLWISVTPNGDATMRDVSYQDTSSVSFSCTVTQPIIDNTIGGSNGSPDNNNGGDSSSKYGMTVLQMHRIAISYTGLCQLEMQVKLWNNDTKSIGIAPYYFDVRTSFGADNEAEPLTRDYWSEFTLSPGGTATVWLKVEPGCGVGITHLSFTRSGITFGCNIDPAMLVAATSPWSMSVKSINYVHYSNQNSGLRMCQLEIQLINNDYSVLKMNIDQFVGYDTDSVRHDASWADVDYVWSPFDIAPGKSTTVKIMFEVSTDVQIEHLVYNFVGYSPIECDVP